MTDPIARLRVYRFQSAKMTLAALNKYARHLPGCLHNPRAKREYTADCTCGLAEAFATIQDALKRLAERGSNA